MIWKKKGPVFQKTPKKADRKSPQKARRGKLLWKMLSLIGGSAAIVFCVMIVCILLNLKQSVNQLTSSSLEARS